MPYTTRSQLHGDEALFIDVLFDDAGVWSPGLQRSGCPRGIFRKEEGKDFAIGRPARLGKGTGQVGHLPAAATASGHDIELQLARLLSIGQESKAAAIRRPSKVVLDPRRSALSARDPSCSSRRRAEVQHRDG